jgi:hypothetical protein
VADEWCVVSYVDVLLRRYVVKIIIFAHKGNICPPHLKKERGLIGQHRWAH